METLLRMADYAGAVVADVTFAGSAQPDNRSRRRAQAPTLAGMQVRFERTGPRRYAVAILRDQHGDLRMDPAPGYSELIPHDLVHLVVEEEFGLRDGIFGQLAAGGNAGTFVPTEELRTKAWARQVERRNRSTGTEMARSEDLVAQVYPRWLRRRGLAPDSHYVLQDPPPTELSEQDLDRVFVRLDALSDQWRGVEVGAGMAVAWRWPERVGSRIDD